MGVVQTQAETIAVLTVQLFTRVLLLLVAVSLLGSTPALRAGQLDSLMLAFRNFFAMQLLAILVCLFLRVYRVAAWSKWQVAWTAASHLPLRHLPLATSQQPSRPPTAPEARPPAGSGRPSARREALCPERGRCGAPVPAQRRSFCRLWTVQA